MDSTLTSVLAALSGSVIGASTPVPAISRSSTKRHNESSLIAKLLNARNSIRNSYAKERVLTQKHFHKAWKTSTKSWRCMHW